MPIRKRNGNYKKYIIAAAAIVLIALMIISFAPTRHVTEVLLLG